MKVVTAGDNCMDVYDLMGKAYPGGNPVNVAVYWKRLGGEASYIGAVGDDDYGERMQKAISGKGVDTSHLYVMHGHTAITHVEVVEGNRVFGQYDEGVLEDFCLSNEDMRFISHHDLFVSGIWGGTDDRIPEIYKMGIPVAFDFATKWKHPLVRRLAPYVTYGFFALDDESEEELKTVIGESHVDKDELMNLVKDFMYQIHDLGTKVVVVTMGEQGSLAWDGEQLYKFGIVNCAVVDTMGAGDSYIAGFLFARMIGGDISKAMKAGAQNSSITLGYSGAW